MIYKDKIYGKLEIEEPIILELISTPAFLRLKGIEQAGFFEPHFPGSAKSRFEHSLGVFILLKKFGASLEEQVAGLIHDVSHGVFSHCLDYALGARFEKNHAYQDKILEKFIKKSEIPGILKKHGLDLDFILNDKNFPLKEKPLPDLCADRIDYSLRDAVSMQIIEPGEVSYFLSNLFIKNKFWVFKSFKSAKEFTRFFFKMNRLVYSGVPSALMFRTVGDYLKYTLEKGYITDGDLYTTDREVLEKINRYLKRDNQLKILWQRVNNKVKFKIHSRKFNAHVFCKSRAVNPLFEDKGIIKRISEVDKKWAGVIKKESRPKEYFIKFEK